MLFSTLSSAVMALSVFASSAGAFPTWPGYGHPQPRATKLQSMQALFDGFTKDKALNFTLAKPDGLELKFVGLGIGTQNYTCLTGSDTAEPGTTGALARLFDIGTSLNKDRDAKKKISNLSGLALSLYTSKRPQALNDMLRQGGYQELLGDHYFTVKVPTFSLNKVKANPFPVAFVTKAGEMDAPKGSCPGAKNEGAIKWLQLSDVVGASVGGVNTVYRLYTAGGNKPTQCKGQKQNFEVAYAAQYWIYGPAS